MLAGFSFCRDGSTQGDSTCKRLKRLFYFFLALKPPDLPIKMPDLDITAVYKLASGTTRGGMEMEEGGHAETEWNQRAAVGNRRDAFVLSCKFS